MEESECHLPFGLDLPAAQKASVGLIALFLAPPWEGTTLFVEPLVSLKKNYSIQCRAANACTGLTLRDRNIAGARQHLADYATLELHGGIKSAAAY